MNGSIFRLWLAIRTSYWFIPALMAFAAILLGPLMVWVDVQLGDDWASEHIGWYQSIKASGARDVLSTIAGSMITVAGVVFSITIVAISFASGQYGPRLLTNFMSDRGNTLALGTFIATFVYCLVVLRTIRGGDDDSFVPQLSVLVGILLALCSIGVLIYFIHHVPRSIHVNDVVASVGRQLLRGVEERFPAFIGEPASEADEGGKERMKQALSSHPSCPVESDTTGYVQGIDESSLIETACKHDLFLRLRYRPGDFVAAGRPLADVWPAAAVDKRILDDLEDAFTVGKERTPYGDLHFLINELVEISARALSSGVNDPLTAATCIDWLGAAMGELATRRIPDPYRAASDGKPRILALPDDFATFMRSSFGKLRPYGATDPVASRHLLRTLGIVAANCCTRRQIAALEEERALLTQVMREKLDQASLQALEPLSLELKDLLALPPGDIDERQADWLGGSA